MADMDPLDALGTAIATDPRDWSKNETDAFIYGIICGWNWDSLVELCETHGWPLEYAHRIKKAHNALGHAWKNRTKHNGH